MKISITMRGGKVRSLDVAARINSAQDAMDLVTLVRDAVYTAYGVDVADLIHDAEDELPGEKNEERVTH